jgi:hypothetical protein
MISLTWSLQLLVDRRDHRVERVEDVVLEQRGVASAVLTSVATALSTSFAARSLRGLKLCLRRLRTRRAPALVTPASPLTL